MKSVTHKNFALTVET